MRSDKPNVHYAVRIIHSNDESIFVATDIEHNSTVRDDTGGAERSFNLRGGSPIRRGAISYAVFDIDFHRFAESRVTNR